MFSLAMTQVTQEDLLRVQEEMQDQREKQENLQRALTTLEVKLTGRLQMLKESEEGALYAVATLQQDNIGLKTLLFEHVSSVEQKFKNDVEEARRQLVVMKGDLAEVKTSQFLPSTQAPEASAHVGRPAEHLTRRKGFDGLATYGGGAQWKDWRFSTVLWLSQESKFFEDL